MSDQRNTHVFKDYASAMSEIRLPDQYKKSILAHLDTADQTGQKRVEIRYTPSFKPRLIAACSLAAILVICGLVLTNHPKEIESPQGNSFVLAAYAEGSALKDSKDTVLAPSSFISAGVSWSENDDGTASINFPLDLTFLGSDIKKVSYQISGSDVHFNVFDSREHSQGTSQAGTEVTGDYSKTLTVNKPSAASHFSVYLTIEIPIQDDLAAVREQTKENGYQNLSQYSAAVVSAAAHELPQHTISVTATLEDGSTIKQNYRISPIDQFERLYKKVDEKTDGISAPNQQLLLIKKLS